MADTDRIDRDRLGFALCPICGPQPLPYLDCLEADLRGLYVTHELDVMVDPDHYDHGPGTATTGTWKVTCINGHVILTSRDFGEGDEELPPIPFTPALLTEDGRASARAALEADRG